ncbi:MAG: TIR domain-containing protein [Nitrospirae bacterium]|nr:TIR domain-containing protein [Magnetococcales bacterium]HAT51237.1 hypothetical protein [Alphaproteobacteria bacterium]
MAPSAFSYKAFISYSHKDQWRAQWFRYFLSRMKMPKDDAQLATLFKEQITDDRLFMDEAAIGAIPSLSEKVKESLRQAEFLIVICTPHAARSEWVDQEIRYFKQHRGAENIIFCLFKGTPLLTSGNGGTLETIPAPDQCLPRALRYRIDFQGETINQLEDEPAWADFRWNQGTAWGTELARVASSLLRVAPDRLILFQQRRSRQMMQATIALSVIVAVIMTGLGLFAWYQKGQAVHNLEQAHKNLAESWTQTAHLEVSQGRIRNGVKKGFDAYGIHPDWLTRMGLWDTLGHLPSEQVYNLKRPLIGKGLHVLGDGRLVVVAEDKVVVYEENGSIRQADHDAGLSLTSTMATDGETVFILGQKRGRLLRFALGEMRFTVLADHGQSCSWMAKARDRDRLVLGCEDGSIMVYDVAQGGALTVVWRGNKTPAGKQGSASVAITNDGNSIFWAYGPGMVTRWDLPGDRMVWQQPIHDRPAEFRMSHGGDWVAWYTHDGHVGMVGVADGRYLWDKKLEGGLFDLAFSPDDNRLAVAVVWPPETSRKPGLVEWELASGRETMVYEAPERFSQVAYSDEGHLFGLIVQGAVYEILPVEDRHFIPTVLPVRQLWKGKEGDEWYAMVCGALQGPTERITVNQARMIQTFAMVGPSLLADHQCLAKGYGILQRFADEASLPEMVAGSEGATVAAVLPDGQFLVGTADGQVKRVDPGHPEKNQVLTAQSLGDSIHFIGFVSPDFVVVSQRFGQKGSGIYRLGESGLTPYFLLEENHDNARWLVTGEINNFIVLPTPGRILIAVNVRWQGAAEGKVIQFDLNARKIISETALPGGIVLDMTSIPGGNRIALALASGQIALLNTNTWKVEKVIENGVSSATTLMAWKDSEAGVLLLAGDAGGSLTIHGLEDSYANYRTLPLTTPILSQAYDGGEDTLALGTPQGVIFIDGLKDVKLPDITGVHPDLGTLSVDEMVQRAKVMKDNGLGETGALLLKEAVRLRPWDTVLIDNYSQALQGMGLVAEALEQVNEKSAWESHFVEQSGKEEFQKLSRLNHVTASANVFHSKWENGGDSQQLLDHMRVVLDGLREMPDQTMLHLMFQISLWEAGQFETLFKWTASSLAIEESLEPSVMNPRWLEKFGIYSALLLGTPEVIKRESIERAYNPDDANFGPGHRVIRKMLLDPNHIETDFSDVEKQAPRDAHRDMAVIHLLLGLANQRQGKLSQARQHFQQGQYLGDYFTLNRQALQRMEGRWKPLEVPAELTAGYEAIMMALQAKPLVK